MKRRKQILLIPKNGSNFCLPVSSFIFFSMMIIHPIANAASVHIYTIDGWRFLYSSSPRTRVKKINSVLEAIPICFAWLEGSNAGFTQSISHIRFVDFFFYSRKRWGAFPAAEPMMLARKRSAMILMFRSLPQVVTYSHLCFITYFSWSQRLLCSDSHYESSLVLRL